MRWNLKCIYRILYTFMTMLCIGGLVYASFVPKDEKTERIQIFAQWGEISVMEQLGWLMVGLLVFAGVFVILYLCNEKRLLKLMIAMGTGCYIAYCFAQRWEIATFVIIIAVIMILQGMLEYLIKDAIYTLPLFLLFGAVLLLFPAKEKPLQWKMVKAVYNKIKNVTNEFQAKLDYYNEEEDSFASFSQTPSFGGKIKDNDVEQLCLVGDGKETGMYLSGKVYNIYTEEGWQNAITPETYNENGWNYVQLLAFLNYAGVEPEQVRSICRRRSYLVQYKTIYTKTAFTYLNTIAYDAGKGNDYTYHAGSGLFDEPKENGFKYNITYIDVNYGNETLQEMWKQVDSSDIPLYDYEELNQCSLDYFNIELDRILSEEEYSKEAGVREQVIADNYLEVPEHIPERVKILAQEITRGCGSDFEKVSAIAEYLHGFTYNRHPMDMEGNCVVDSFLFDSKEGYCTHFASAMVLLSRCVDIPARYVSGFYLGESDKSEDDTYLAKGNNAHAWAECYIDGYGFLPVEATSGYFSSTIQQWSQNEMDSDAVNRLMDEQVTKDEQIAEEQNLREQKKKEISGAISVGLMVTFVIICLIILIVIVWGVLRFKTYKRSGMSEQCRILWYLQMKLLTRMNMGILPGETLREYDARLQQEGISKCINLYEKIQYGQMPCDIKEKEQFCIGLKQCRKQLRAGRFWLWWYFMTCTILKAGK